MVFLIESHLIEALNWGGKCAAQIGPRPSFITAAILSEDTFWSRKDFISFLVH